ncbi:hypothetical protein F4780DRAFT_552294 [Xylariomycetidae sp. FL0641]|nr:hypothetical protein F4780DRAFT_552294 [Xylariomycetidae sp. FL0641]
MRTRRQGQDKAGAADTEPATTSARDNNVQPSSSSANSPNTVVRISKVESPSVQKRDDAAEPPVIASKLPPSLQFPLVAILSLALSQLGYSLTWYYTKGAYAAHARILHTWTEVGLVTGWRICELALGWYGNYDGYDLTALHLLSHGPPLYLLYAHYEMPATALLLTLAIETLATYAPFRLLRPLSRAHGDPSHIPNAEIATDTPIALLTTLLAGAIYSVTLLFAYATYLPTALVVYFDGLPSIVRAHESSYVGLLPVSLALGFAARVFLFTPAVPADAKTRNFDPVAASLGDTLLWNLWGWSDQTKVVLSRTALLMLLSGANSFVQTALTINGVEAHGAAAWSSVWVLAAAITGVAMAAVGSG